MQEDSENVTLSPSEFQSGTLVWDSPEVGTWRVGIASTDHSDYSDGDIVEATVLIGQLKGEGAIENNGNLRLPSDITLDNQGMIISDISGIYPITSDMTILSDMGGLQSLLFSDTTTLVSDTLASADYVRRRPVGIALENDTFIVFEGADFQYAEFNPTNTTVITSSPDKLVGQSVTVSNTTETDVVLRAIYRRGMTVSNESIIDSMHSVKFSQTSDLSNNSVIDLTEKINKFSVSEFSGAGAVLPSLSQSIVLDATLSNDSLIEYLTHRVRTNTSTLESDSTVISTYNMSHRMVVDYDGAGVVEPLITKRRSKVKGRYRLEGRFIEKREFEAITGDEHLASLILDR